MPDDLNTIDPEQVRKDLAAALPGVREILQKVKDSGKDDQGLEAYLEALQAKVDDPAGLKIGPLSSGKTLKDFLDAHGVKED